MNHLTLLKAAVAANGKPAVGSNVGVPIRAGHPEHVPGEGLYAGCERASCVVWNSAGTGAVALGYVRLWIKIAGIWFPLGEGPDADKGKLNAAGGFALATTDVDQLRHQEYVYGFQDADRMYAEIFGIGGAAAPAFEVALHVKDAR